MIADAGADAIGLNFFADSPRSVDVETASEIALALPPEVAKVGVFVNHSVAEIEEIAYRVNLDTIQLHGDETVDFVQQLGDRSMIKAFRCRDDGLNQVGAFVADCERNACRLDAVLIDAYVAGQFGGTGEVVDWTSVTKRDVGGIPVILAGGLAQDNVREAIRTAHPDAVDTASGVESSPGQKDEELVRAFVREAQAGFANL